MTDMIYRGMFSRESARGTFVVRLVAIATVVVVLAGSAAYAQVSTAVRTITGVNVSIDAQPDQSQGGGYLVQETLPAGLTATNISNSGFWDSTSKSVKWVFLTDNTPRTLTYTATGALGSYVYLPGLSVISVAGIDTPITGDTVLNILLALTYTAGANGSIAGTSPQSVASGADGTPVTPVPNAGYHFVQWSDGSTQNPRTDTNVTANISVTASFAINIYTLSINVSPSGAGTVVTNPPGPAYSAGSIVLLTAMGNPGYSFDHWAGASEITTPSAASTTVLMDANLNVTANFVPIFTLTYTAGPNGVIIGPSSQTVNSGASGTAVTAMAASDYRFLQWSDASTQNPRTDTNVMASVNVMANFEPYIRVPNVVGMTQSAAQSSITAAGLTVGIVTQQSSMTVPVGDVISQSPVAGTQVAPGYAVALVVSSGVDPVITMQPMSQTVYIGGTATFSVSATGTLPLAYQWLKGGGYIPGATNATFIIASVRQADAGSYSCVVTGVDVVTSQAATLVVISPEPPTGTIMINGGAAYASSALVTLALSASEVNGPGVTQMQFSNDAATWSGWQTYATSAPWTLTSGDGPKTVYAQYRDAVGTVSTGAISAGITLDTTPPTVTISAPSATLTRGGPVMYTVTYADTGSGVTGITLQTSDITLNRTGTATGALTVSGMGNSTRTVTVSSITGDGTIGIAIGAGTATDIAGNTAGTSQPSAACRVDNTPPSFSNIAANPNVASLGTAVTLTFTSSETLASNPTVTVNANMAAYQSNLGNNYTYVYIIQVDDSAGAATISISGTDLAGNAGSTTSTTTLAVNPLYTLTYAASANGAISGTSPQTVNSGASGTAVTATPNAHYHFVQWSDTSTQNPRTDTNVTANIGVTASFALNTYSLTYMAGANGSISGTSPQTVNYWTDGAMVTAVPATGYHFVNWSDGSTQNPRADTNVTANISVTANFAVNTYMLMYTAGPNGTVSGASSQVVSYGASGSAVTAAPNAGYHFVNWSDASTQNPRTDTNVTANISVTANFAVNTYMLMYTAGPNGTVSGASPQTVTYGMSGTAVTATPNAGYHFVNWSDASTLNPRRDTNVTANISVTASFAINGGNAAITVKTYVSVDCGTTWNDANTTPGPQALVGGEVQFEYVVTNTGNVTLTGITLTDATDGGTAEVLPCPVQLAAQGSFTVSTEQCAEAGSHSDLATVTGIYNSGVYTATDEANYDGILSSWSDDFAALGSSDLAVLGMEKVAVTLSSGNTFVSGDVGIGPSGSLTFSGGGRINGAIDYAASAKVTVSGGSTATGGKQVMDMSGIDSAAHQAYLDTLALAPTQTFGGLKSKQQTIQSTGPINVIQITGDINLQGGATLTLAGQPGDLFIFNVLGQVVMGGNSVITSTAGEANDILFNVVGNITLSGGSTVGTFLTNTGAITVSGGVNTGAFIGGGSFLKLQGGPSVYGAPFTPYKCKCE